MVSAVPRPLCIYHKNCLDGKAAAAVVLRRAPDAELLPMQYREPAPQVEKRAVYVVDFALPLEAMRALKAQASEVVWIDHHATSQPIRERLGWGHLDTTTCGAVLSWRVLFPDRPMPAILPYIEDKDLWLWRLPDSRAVAAGLARAFGGTDLAGLLDADPARMAELGRGELAAQAARVQEWLRQGVEVRDPYGLSGLRMLAVLANRDQNEIAEAACRPAAEGGPGYDLAVVYWRRKDGTWVHSLRSARVDCAAIAERFGGGGHPASAGYMAPDPVVRPPATPPAS
jgi:oligoribonuclease NrnB/cAMP/cGMP phosphodiesterase (DHH superfamily)